MSSALRGRSGHARCARSGRVQCLAGRADQGAERLGLPDGEIGEDLAIDVDLGGLQPGDEPRVADVVLAAGRVDAHDPELAELTLARPAVAVRVPERVHDLLVGRLE